MDIWDLQVKVKEIVEVEKIDTLIDIRMLDLCSEMGELCNEFLRSNKYGTSKFKVSENFEEEFGEVLFSLICIANSTDIKLDDALEKALVKYEKSLSNNSDIS